MADRPDVVAERLAKIEQAVGVIEQAQAATPDLSVDLMRLYAVERGLHVAIENVFHVGAYIITHEGWPRARHPEEVPRILGEQGVLPTDLARRIASTAGLWNMLAHGYANVEPRLYQQVLANLADFRAFTDHVQAYLRSREAPGPQGAAGDASPSYPQVPATDRGVPRRRAGARSRRGGRA